MVKEEWVEEDMLDETDRATPRPSSNIYFSRLLNCFLEHIRKTYRSDKGNPR